MNKENRYYVYLHRDLDGVVFYVGKGTKNRLNLLGSRSEKWKERSKNGWTSEIMQGGLSNKEAMLLETETINKYKDTVVNSGVSKSTRELSFEELSEIFYYDETSPSGLRWKVPRFKNKGAKLHSAGDVAGNKKYLDNGVPRCWRLSLMWKDYVVHRIVWVLLNGDLDTDLVIDHLDGNAFNNKIDNLQPKSMGNNSRNRKNKPNALGFSGVTLRTNPSGTECYRATWSDENGKLCAKHFAVNKYGNDIAFQLACEYRVARLEELRLKGFDYTDRHILQ